MSEQTANIPFISSNQRIIVPDHIIPAEQRVQTALDENVIADHLEKFLMADDNRDNCKVFSSVLGGCHVYCFPPSEILKRNFWTLVSMGMSGTKMNVPEEICDAQDYQYAEALCYVPFDWEMPAFSNVEEITANNWPVEMLRSLAAYVSATRCWIAEDHGLPNLIKPHSLNQSFHESTKLSNMILLDPVEEDEDFSSVNIDGKRVNFYLVVPLTPAEAQWKREVGAEKSIYYIVGNKRAYPENVLVDYVIDSSRPCAVTDLNCREHFDNLAEGEEGDDEDDDESAEDIVENDDKIEMNPNANDELELEAS